MIKEVKKIYFEENGNMPTFEMVDGTIKKPYLRGDGYALRPIWLTDLEYKTLKIKDKIEDNINWWEFWKY